MLDKINVMLDDGAYMPTRAHEEDSGLDLYSPIPFTMAGPDSYVAIDTGVHIEIPKGYTGFLKSKSGLNVKFGIRSEGVIDSGYTGSIVVKLYRNSKDYTPKFFDKGDKITQLVILPIETPTPVLVESFKETDRGDNGFGSTG